MGDDESVPVVERVLDNLQQYLYNNLPPEVDFIIQLQNSGLIDKDTAAKFRALAHSGDRSCIRDLITHMQYWDEATLDKFCTFLEKYGKKDRSHLVTVAAKIREELKALGSPPSQATLPSQLAPPTKPTLPSLYQHREVRDEKDFGGEVNEPGPSGSKRSQLPSDGQYPQSKRPYSTTKALPPSASQSQNQHVTGNNQQHMVNKAVSAPEPDQHQYSQLDSSFPHPNAKTQSSNTPYQPAPATATIPQEPVADGDEPSALVARFAIVTANRNERESAKLFMGASMRDCEISNSDLKEMVPEILKAFQTDGISVEFAKPKPFLECRKVAGTKFWHTYTYFYVKVCGVLGVLTECYRMGSHSSGASRDTVNVLLETAHEKKWDLDSVFLVGCCGCAHDPEVKVDLGTVLISKSIIPYLVKITDDKVKLDPKNDYDIDEVWVALLIKQNAESRELKVQNLQDTYILSGDTLMACGKLAESLRKSTPRNIPVLGFEMEGAGAHEAISNWQSNLANPKRPAILVVKGVSDFANSDKNACAPTAFFETKTEEVDKDSRQQMCTMMSLMVVCRAIKAKWGLKEEENPVAPS